jgi:hypothetical protein
MSNYATPQWLLSLAAELEYIAKEVRETGRSKASNHANRLRNLADILEQKI